MEAKDIVASLKRIGFEIPPADPEAEETVIYYEDGSEVVLGYVKEVVEIDEQPVLLDGDIVIGYMTKA